MNTWAHWGKTALPRRVHTTAGLGQVAQDPAPVRVRIRAVPLRAPATLGLAEHLCPACYEHIYLLPLHCARGYRAIDADGHGHVAICPNLRRRQVSKQRCNGAAITVASRAS